MGAGVQAFQTIPDVTTGSLVTLSAVALHLCLLFLLLAGRWKWWRRRGADTYWVSCYSPHTEIPFYTSACTRLNVGSMNSAMAFGSLFYNCCPLFRGSPKRPQHFISSLTCLLTWTSLLLSLPITCLVFPHPRPNSSLSRAKHPFHILRVSV